MKLNSSSLPTLALLLLSSNLFGATPAPVITIDEYGNGDVNGTVLASHLALILIPPTFRVRLAF